MGEKMNKINLKIAGKDSDETLAALVAAVSEYIDRNPLPRDESATVLVAGGPSMVKEDQLPSGGYAGHFWQSVNYTYEPKPPSLLDWLGSEDGNESEPGPPCHRFQAVKFWALHDGTNPIGDQTRDAGIAWQIDIIDTGHVTVILVDPTMYNAVYLFRLLGEVLGEIWEKQAGGNK